MQMQRSRRTQHFAFFSLHTLVICKRSFSDFHDSSDGHAWKQRYLQERRDTALEFLGDVKKRVPIHDAIRQRASINRAAAKDVDCAQFFGDIAFVGKEPSDDYASSSTSVVDELIDDLMLEENAVDRLQHIDLSDLPLLDNELLGDDVTDEETLRRWLKLKRDTADYQSYASVPEGERNAWSAWYLRHVKGKNGV